MGCAIFILFVSIILFVLGYFGDYTLGDILGKINPDWSTMGADLGVAPVGIFLFIFSLILIAILKKRRPKVFIRCANSECGWVGSKGTWDRKGKCPRCESEMYDIVHFPDEK